MGNKIPRFTDGEINNLTNSISAKNKLNKVVETVNNLDKIEIFGDGVECQKGAKGKKFLIKKPSKAGEFNVIWCKVIEQPLYEDATDFDIGGGRSYYTVRPTGITYNVWDDEVTYLKDEIVQYPNENSPSYKALDAPSTNLNKNPVTETEYWEKQEEIRIFFVLGQDLVDESSPARDIRHYIPWFQVNSFVPIIYSDYASSTGELRPYIFMAMPYCGVDNDASLRWNETEERAMACYK